MQDVTIRPATKSDQAALGRFGGALMRQHHEADPQRFIITDHPEAGYGRYLVSQLEDPETLVLVAERAGEVVGYLYGSLEPMDWMQLRAPCGFVHDVIVEASARRQGAGEKLMRAAIEWFRSKNQPRVVLWSADRNETAQIFFAGLGFRRTMVEMTLELEPGAPGAPGAREKAGG